MLDNPLAATTLKHSRATMRALTPRCPRDLPLIPRPHTAVRHASHTQDTPLETSIACARMLDNLSRTP